MWLLSAGGLLAKFLIFFFFCRVYGLRLTGLSWGQKNSNNNNNNNNSSSSSSGSSSNKLFPVTLTSKGL